jgi:hypothetical protein
MSHGTLSNDFPGWYVTFQTDILSQLPRPGELSEDVADGWHANRESMKRALSEALCPPTVKPEPQPVLPILKFIDTVTLPARTTRFVPKDSFVVNTKKSAHVKIGYIDPDFTRWFGEKAEEPTGEAALRQNVLARPSAFAPAMKEVADGGIVTKTTPGELYSMLEKQPDGPKSAAGSLLTNGYANLFEMDDVNGVARLVHAHWHDVLGGWGVFADDASDSFRWDAGFQLFSRDSR